MKMDKLTVLEACAGGGGQALGLEAADFEPVGLIEIDKTACDTLRINRPGWPVVCSDIRELHGRNYRGIDLLAAGVPCPPFSVAGKQLGPDDDRDLFPEALRLIREAAPRAVLLENVRGFAGARFTQYRRNLCSALSRMGYFPEWRVLNASDFGVPQLRPRFILVAVASRYAAHLRWPEPATSGPPHVGATLRDLMGSRGWLGAQDWARRASGPAPTIVGGSSKHGGPDLGPTRARAQWRTLGIDGIGIADLAPSSDADLETLPRLTTRMVARLQAFPDEWQFAGRKTAAYRQVGNALPPPVAEAIGRSIRAAIESRGR